MRIIIPQRRRRLRRRHSRARARAHILAPHYACTYTTFGLQSLCDASQIQPLPNESPVILEILLGFEQFGLKGANCMSGVC